MSLPPVSWRTSQKVNEVGVRETQLKEALHLDGVAYMTLPGGGPIRHVSWPEGMPVKDYNVVARVLNAVFFLAGPSESMGRESHGNFQVVGYIERFDCSDPFFWESTLDDTWVRELPAMMQSSLPTV